MFRNRKFSFYAVTLCLTGFVYMFLCACLESGQLEAFRGQLTGGWTAAQVDRPVAVGALLAVPVAWLCLEGYLRRGVRQGMIVWGAAAALGCIGLMNAQSVYGLFFASMVLVRCACTALQIGVMVLCAQWFVRYRGRALGLTSMGAPVFSAVGAAAMADFIQTRLGGDCRPFYLTVAALLALLALAARFLLRDRPEDAGLYPDGDGRAPADEPDEPEAPLGPGALLKSGRAWLALLCLGALVTAAVGCLDYLDARLIAKAGGGATLLDHAAPWLALGAILGIPVSYLFGWLCDRLGAWRVAMVLAIIEMGAVWLLWRFPKEVDAAEGVGLCLTMACLLGAVSTVVPSVMAGVFGRQQMLPACRVLLPVLLLPAALSGPVGALLGGGSRDRLYLVLLIAGAAALITAPLLRPKKSRKKEA